MRYVMPIEMHNNLVQAAYMARGFGEDESRDAAYVSQITAHHGIKTHNAIKALHLDELFGSRAGGCAPGAEIEVIDTPFKAVQRWDAHRKLGQSVALRAMRTAMELADTYGIGFVSVDNAFHYLWGGGYAIDAANKGYIAYTCCTAALAEVVPFMGTTPTLGTNPHSWAFPTRDAIGFNVCVDWATSTVSMGKVQQLAREGQTLPDGIAVDAKGQPTKDPNNVAALLPFGAHKGYGLSLIDELYAAFTGGSRPTLRSRWSQGPEDEKHSPNFFFQCIHPEAITPGRFAQSRDQKTNVKAVIDDILGHGNDKAILPGQIEARAAQESEKHGGLIFSQAEIEAFAEIATEAGVPFDRDHLREID